MCPSNGWGKGLQEFFGPDQSNKKPLVLVARASLLGARTLLVAPGLATSSKDATRNSLGQSRVWDFETDGLVG